MIDPILAKLFGTKNTREIKTLQPMIAAINDLEPSLKPLSDIDLAAKTHRIPGAHRTRRIAR